MNPELVRAFAGFVIPQRSRTVLSSKAVETSPELCLKNLKDEAQFFGSERREERPQMDTVQLQMDTNCLVPSIRIRFESFVVPTYPWFVDATIKLSQKDGLGRWGSSSIAMISPWTGNTCPTEKFRTRSKHLSWLAVYQICISPWLCFKQHSNKWMFRVMGNTCAKCHTVQPFPTFFSLRRISADGRQKELDKRIDTESCSTKCSNGVTSRQRETKRWRILHGSPGTHLF